MVSDDTHIIVEVSADLLLGAALPAEQTLPPRIEQKRRRAIVISLGVGAGSFVVVLAALVALKTLPNPHSTALDILTLFVQAFLAAPVAVAFVCHAKLTSSGMTLLWLRKFRPNDRGKYRLQYTIKGATAGLIHPITIQDSSYRTSYLPGVMNPTVVPLLTLLAIFGMVAVGVPMAMLGGSATQFLAAVIAWFVCVGLIGYWTVRRLGYSSFVSRDGPGRAAMRLSQIKSGKKGLLSNSIDVWKCSNENWQRAIDLAVGASEIVIVDLSQVNENIWWEIRTVRAQKRPVNIIWTVENGSAIDRSLVAEICAEYGVPDGNLAALVRAGGIFVYPAAPLPWGLPRYYYNQSKGLRALLLARLANIPAEPNAVPSTQPGDEGEPHPAPGHRRMILGGGIAIVLVALGVVGWNEFDRRRKVVLAQKQLERERAARASAVNTANILLGNLAQRLREAGVPAAIIDDFLQQARTLADQPTGSGEPRLVQARRLFSMLAEIVEALLSRGAMEMAIAAPNQGHTIFTLLVEQAWDDIDCRRQYAALNAKVGDVLITKLDYLGALGFYRVTLTLREDIAKLDPGNIEWQHDLAVAYTKIGDAELGRRSAPGLMYFRDITRTRISWIQPWRALDWYSKSLTIFETLAQADPNNTSLQRDLAMAYSTVGGTQFGIGQYEKALATARMALAVWERLANSDPAHIQWQRELAGAHSDVGDAQRATDDPTGSLHSYQTYFKIALRVANSDPNVAEWQRDLALSYIKVGLIHQDLRRFSEARAAFEAGRGIIARLLAQHPSTDLQEDLEWFDRLIAGPNRR